MADRDFRCGETVWVWDGDYRHYKVVGMEGEDVTLQTVRGDGEDARLHFFNVPRTRVWRSLRSAREAVSRDMGSAISLSPENPGE